MKQYISNNKLLLVLIFLMINTFTNSVLAQFEDTDVEYISSKRHIFRTPKSETKDSVNEIYTDSLTKLSATKKITKKIIKGTEIIAVDSFFRMVYSPFTPQGYTQAEYFFQSDDSTIAFLDNRLWDNEKERQTYIDAMTYDASEFVSYIQPNFKVFRFDVISEGNYKEEHPTSKIIFKKLTMEEVRTLPLRDLVDSRIKNLGTHTFAYRQERSKPLTHQEIVDTLKLVRGEGIDYLMNRTENPFDAYVAIADIVMINMLIEYFNIHIKKVVLRDCILESLKDLRKQRIKDIIDATKFCCNICKLSKEKIPATHKPCKLNGPPFDIQKEKNYPNIVQWKTTVYRDSTKIDTLNTFVHPVSGEIFPMNPKGIVTASFFQIFPESLKSLMRNFDYDVRKIYKFKMDSARD